MLVASSLTAKLPELELSFLNRGISGNRSKDLAARWQEDCIGLKPDWVSVLIGVNDTWRRFDQNDPTTAQEYARNVRDVFSRTVENGMRLIVWSHLSCR
jgi:lysophospholipase L1-like esterase